MSGGNGVISSHFESFLSFLWHPILTSLDVFVECLGGSRDTEEGTEDESQKELWILRFPTCSEAFNKQIKIQKMSKEIHAVQHFASQNAECNSLTIQCVKIRFRLEMRLKGFDPLVIATKLCSKCSVLSSWRGMAKKDKKNCSQDSAASKLKKFKRQFAQFHIPKHFRKV